MNKSTKNTTKALLKQRRKHAIANKRRKVVPRQKRTLVQIKTADRQIPKGESPIILKNLHFLQFLCFEASAAQGEEILFEIEPAQLAAIRELISNVSFHNKELAQEYWDETLVEKKCFVKSEGKHYNHTKAKKCRRNVEFFIKKLLDQKATRVQLRKNAKMLKFALRKALKMYENREGVTSSSSAGKKRTFSSQSANSAASKRIKRSEDDQSVEQSSEESEAEEGQLSSETEKEEKQNYDEDQSHSSSPEDSLDEAGQSEEEDDEDPQEQNEGDQNDHTNIDEEETNAFEDSESEVDEDE